MRLLISTYAHVINEWNQFSIVTQAGKQYDVSV